MQAYITVFQLDDYKLDVPSLVFRKFRIFYHILSRKFEFFKYKPHLTNFKIIKNLRKFY